MAVMDWRIHTRSYHDRNTLIWHILSRGKRDEVQSYVMQKRSILCRSGRYEEVSLSIFPTRRNLLSIINSKARFFIFKSLLRHTIPAVFSTPLLNIDQN